MSLKMKMFGVNIVFDLLTWDLQGRRTRVSQMTGVILVGGINKPLEGALFIAGSPQKTL